MGQIDFEKISQKNLLHRWVFFGGQKNLEQNSHRRRHRNRHRSLFREKNLNRLRLNS